MYTERKFADKTNDLGFVSWYEFSDQRYYYDETKHRRFVKFTDEKELVLPDENTLTVPVEHLEFQFLDLRGIGITPLMEIDYCPELERLNVRFAATSTEGWINEHFIYVKGGLLEPLGMKSGTSDQAHIFPDEKHRAHAIANGCIPVPDLPKQINQAATYERLKRQFENCDFTPPILVAAEPPRMKILGDKLS